MNGSRVGWLSLLIMVSMLSLTRLPAGAPADPVAAKPGEGMKPPESGSSAPAAQLWDEPARLVSAVTGKSWDGSVAGGSRWKDLGLLAKGAGFTRVDPLIALVPCPVDSNLAADYDQALAAIQQSYADAGYLLEGWWLPWTGDAEKDRTHSSVPGILVFRRFDLSEMAVVLVVGEVPVLGIHSAAFDEAVDAVRSWNREGPVTVRIVGPTLSDSALSLQRAIEGRKGQGLDFKIVTGSARALQLGDRPWDQLGSTVSFERVVVTEAELQKRARWFFAERMGWDLKQVALLTEADQAYGRPFLIPENAKSFLIVHFPPGISGVRNAWDRDLRPQAAAGDTKGTIKVPDTTLDLRLGDSRRLETLPALSPTTWASRDLAIANLLSTLGNRKVRYIGILASDVRDAIFLVDRVRHFAPGSVVFLVNNNLLYTHPRLAATMSGTLVISEFPLFTKDRRAGLSHHSLEQFTSSLHQGIYEAVGRLIALARAPRAAPPVPDVWVAAVGNGSLWPIAKLDGSERAPVCPLSPWSLGPHNPAVEVRLSPRTANKLLVSAFVILILAWLMNRFAIPPQSTGLRVWWLLASAASTLGLAVGILAVLGTLPYRRLHVRLRLEDWKQIVALLLVFLAFWLLVTIVTRAVGLGRSTRARLKIVGGISVLTLLVFYGLDQILCRTWMFGGIELFYRRAFTFSSSLSPLVSLAWLGGAFYLWAFAELLRQRMQARQEVDWPVNSAVSPALEDCNGEAEELKELLSWPWPRWTHLRSIWALFIPAGVFFLLVIVPIRPIAEPIAYGHVFLFILGVTFFLCAYSFCRFLAAWVILKRMLNRLALPHSPAGLDEAFAKEVAWSPMKSFGWQIPRFKMAIHLADQLRRLANAGQINGQLANDFDRSLEEAITAAKNDYFEPEIEARKKLRDLLSQVDRKLAAKPVTPGSARLATLRLVSYIRYIFAHLRGCLIAAGVCGFPLLAAASTYAFEPNEFVSNWIWGSLLTGVLITLWVFFQMDRDEVLSLISGTAPGKVQLDWHFATNILTYGILPLLGLIASQFPQSGRYLVSLVNPLLHVVGGGG